MIRQILLILVLFVMQVLVINNLELSVYINPYVYPLIILSLPLKTSRPALLFYAFATGLIIDLFLNSPGMHAASLLLLAFMRPFILQSLSPRSNIAVEEMLNVKNVGLSSFFYYTIILVFLHHLFYFFIEVLSFKQFFQTLLKVILSTVFSSLLIVLCSILFSPNKSRS